MFTSEYIEYQRKWLIARFESKREIINNGGIRALLHSPKDLVRIKFALTRIKEEQYGICPCGSFIETGRLDIIPETPFCIRCAQDRNL